MILTVDSMATRYHLLPSQVMQDATTFDLYIMDAAISWQNYQQELRDNGGKPPVPKLSTEDMQKMLAKVNKNGHQYECSRLDHTQSQAY